MGCVAKTNQFCVTQSLVCYNVPEFYIAIMLSSLMMNIFINDENIPESLIISCSKPIPLNFHSYRNILSYLGTVKIRISTQRLLKARIQ